MKIGVCSNYDRWGIVAAAGYDYVEGNFSKIAMATDEEFEVMKKALADSGLKMEATNGFFPSAFQLYSKDDFDTVKKNVREYCELGFARGASLGQKVAVIVLSDCYTWEVGVIVKLFFDNFLCNDLMIGVCAFNKCYGLS